MSNLSYALDCVTVELERAQPHWRRVLLRQAKRALEALVCG